MAPIMTFRYTLQEVAPYINWIYFYHAWGISGRPDEDKLKLRREAEERIAEFTDTVEVRARFRLLDVSTDGDDIIVASDEPNHIIRLPMLRQQHGNPCYCLSDFVNHKGDKMGIFATTVDDDVVSVFEEDPYESLMMQLICDRVAEAAAEKLHERVRKDPALWGYAPDENLTIAQMQSEQWQGIRPAVGYPSLPDQRINFIIGRLLQFHEICIELTESGAMMPHSSVSGLMISHPQARYFSVGKISIEQLMDYAWRFGTPSDDARRFLANLLQD